MYRIILRFQGISSNIAVCWEIEMPQMMEDAMNGGQLEEEDIIVLLDKDVSLVTKKHGPKHGAKHIQRRGEKRDS